MAARPSVALLVESSNAYARNMLRGISAYIREHESWSVFFKELDRGGAPPAEFKSWRGAGIIARIENEQIAKMVTEKNVPIVDVSAARLVENLPWVETDDEAIAQMAFDHLRERGLKHYAFCGTPNFNWSNWRRDHFVRIVRKAGFDCSVHDEFAVNREQWRSELKDLACWVESLPKPVGIMACYDIRARLLLDACRQIEAAVPEQVAVIGVDNDETVCDLSEPRLSSVVPDAFRTGYTAAQLLDSLMSHHDVASTHRIPPLRVQTRESSQILATEDSLIMSSLRYIRERACDGINVQDVADSVNVSRKTLDRRFLSTIGRTPHTELVRVRVDRAKRLLLETRLPLRTIADRAGFAHVEYFSVAFKRLTGDSPSAYRRAGGDQIVSVKHSSGSADDPNEARSEQE